ncbi:hypothetical protein [Phytomonospora endophytica]|uniref:Uncharacterized protein n=1 Tax=Phytomonospora endophytica TaxID=714109 RepID=A0A841FJW7_9ACTN|nr:hypothetical protein [Phytomonospora endophytica]MBB6032929.1 hypothetical protein [Phytomonospora endophytica]GIG65155.1 hypothetical protein Pen01_14500 [Phytomonospora endophytica]
MTALANGVELDDNNAMDEFIQRAGEGRVRYDQELFETIMGRHFQEEQTETGRAFAQPPVALPESEALAAAAATNPLVIALTTLVDWVGPQGRDLVQVEHVLRLPEAREAARLLSTGEADLDVPDATGMPKLSLLIEWAKKTWIIRQYKGRLVQVKKNAALLREPLALFRKAVDDFAELGEAVCVSPWPGESLHDLFTEGFVVHIPDILNSLYGLPSPAPVARMREPIVYALSERWWTEPEGHDEQSKQLRADIDRGLGRAFDLLADYGVLTSEHGTADPMYLADLTGPNAAQFPPRMVKRLRKELTAPTRLIRLTDLGHWAVRERLLAEGLDVPLIGELADVTPVQLLGVIADGLYPAPDAFAEIDIWLSRAGRYAGDLVEAIRTVPFRTRRAALLSVLADALPSGDALLRDLRDDPELAPTAIHLLTDRGELHEDDLTFDESGLMLAESFAPTLELEGPDALRDMLSSVHPPDLPKVVDLVESSRLDAATRAEIGKALDAVRAG